MIGSLVKTKLLFLSGFLLLCIAKPAYAILWINDFNGNDLGWSVVNINDSSTTHTAEATAEAGYIASTTGEYNDGVPAAGDEADWGGAKNYYNGQYFSLYVWGNGNAGETLTIEIIEQDEFLTAPNTYVAVDEIWRSGAIPLSWTGWRYVMLQLPGGASPEFSDTDGTTGDNTWNPAYAAAQTAPPDNKEAVRGVKQINFETNANIYIDQVIISNVTSDYGWVREIFPTNDNETNNIDITLSALPPTVSAVLGTNADSTRPANKIVVIEEDPTNPSNPSYPTDNLCSINGATDGLGGWLVTPSDKEIIIDPASYTFTSSDKFYTMFIHPVNSSDEPGKCEVITFKISVPSSTIENKYKRSLTN